MKGNKAGKNVKSLATANFSMITRHAVTAWIPNGDVVTKQF